MRCRYEYEKVIETTTNDVLNRAFPGMRLPNCIDYEVRDERACDAIIYHIWLKFMLGQAQVSMDFSLDTGMGGLIRIVPGEPEPEPQPSVHNIKLVAELPVGCFGSDETYSWDEKSGAWLRLNTDGEADDSEGSTPQLRKQAKLLAACFINDPACTDSEIIFVARNVLGIELSEDEMDELVEEVELLMRKPRKIKPKHFCHVFSDYLQPIGGAHFAERTS